jgi:ribosome-binding protein aMBF1 (putative translation factor)
MLAVVKTPPIEISISGEGAGEALDWLRRKFRVKIISAAAADMETVNIEQTDFWKEMQCNRIGNLLEAARLKAGLTQKQLAESVDVKQNMVSDYENGKRRLSRQMAKRFAEALGMSAERFYSRK